MRLKPKSDWEKVYESVDKADAEVKRLNALGLDATEAERFAKTLRKLSYSHKRLYRTILVELTKPRNQKERAKWSKMKEDIDEGRLHPRELKAFYDSLMAKKRPSGEG